MTPRRCPKAQCRELQPCTTHPQGWRTASSDTTNPLPRNWAKLRAQIIRLCDRRCNKCGFHDILKRGSVDHIINRARGGKSEMSNLQYLCKTCHDRKTAKERKHRRGT